MDDGICLFCWIRLIFFCLCFELRWKPLPPLIHSLHLHYLSRLQILYLILILLVFISLFFSFLCSWWSTESLCENSRFLQSSVVNTCLIHLFWIAGLSRLWRQWDRKRRLLERNTTCRCIFSSIHGANMIRWLTR